MVIITRQQAKPPVLGAPGFAYSAYYYDEPRRRCRPGA